MVATTILGAIPLRDGDVPCFSLPVGPGPRDGYVGWQGNLSGIYQVFIGLLFLVNAP